MLDEAKQRAQAVNNGKEHADLRNGGEVNAGEQAVGHDGRHFADLVGADDRHHGAQRRQHEGKNDNAHARAHIRARALERADGIAVFLFHLLSPPLREFRGAELGGRDLAVNVTIPHQLFVRADAHGLAAVEHDDLVRVADGADALRDDDLRRVVQLLG